MQASIELCPHFFPRNRLHLARINLANAALNLFSPGGFNFGIRNAMQALKKPPRELSSIRLREARCFLEE